MRAFLPALIFFYCSFLNAQDTLYARRCLKFLTSEKCFGRGYVKNGLETAGKFIIDEIKKANCQPLFGKGYTQSFFHSVNTFPKKCEVRVNGKLLAPGLDYILDPASRGAKGRYRLSKSDSVNYISSGSGIKINVVLKNQLTYSVALEETDHFGIAINRQRFTEIPEELAIDVENKFVKKFESRNICCFINGASAPDSMIVFSAHYDHLGGMGKNTFFPGANDNASGTTLVLDLIKYYSSHPPKYKTVFLFFAGEEAGLLGSKFFTQSNAINLSRIKFLINLDLLGTGDDGIMVVNGAIHEKEFVSLNKINDEKKLVKQIKKRGKAANSDHYWFSEAGVPCFFIYTLGGIAAYHDVMDIEKTLPLTDYVDVFKLLTQFAASF